MIRNQWYVVLESKEVKKNRLTGVLRMGRRLVFWRSAITGQVHCIDDKCVHRGVSLSCGCIKDDRVQCPFHGLEFDGRGTCTRIPANGNNAPVPEYFSVPSFQIRDAHGFIWLWWGDKKETYPSLPFFEDIDERFCFATVKDPWKCHYSRCIENQLDVVHLPFVHRTTIGRGNRTVVNGPRMETTETGIFIYVHNDKDVGQIPKKPVETPAPIPESQHLEFRFPHIWQNYLTDKFRIVIAFVPVDDHNTVLYMRVYQRYMMLPLIRQIINGLNLWLSIVIAHQDRRVVETQVPDITSLKMNEKLIQGDLPIIQYRKMRDALQKQSDLERTAQNDEDFSNDH